jgi:hypothetical protein
LFNLYADWRAMLLIVDLANVKYRYIDDLMYLEHRQSPGDDALKNEFLAECGFELHHAQTHGVIQGLKGAKSAAAFMAMSGGEPSALTEGQGGELMPTGQTRATQPTRTR